MYLVRLPLLGATATMDGILASLGVRATHAMVAVALGKDAYNYKVHHI